MKGRVAIAGASGVIGSAAVQAFASAGFEVLAISRRPPVVPEGTAFKHAALDLTDADQCRAWAAHTASVTHLVYAAVSEEPGLVSGWSDPRRIAENAGMFENLAAPLTRKGTLRWAGLLQGTKAYGAHLHAMRLPARESAPRDPHPNFYFAQEDCLRDLAKTHGFGWTVLRPQVVFGSAPGSAMNPVAAIGAYAALCHAKKIAFCYPAGGPLIWEVTDAELIAEAFLWSSCEPTARNEIFNLTNGDVFVLHDDWDELAAHLQLSPGDAHPLSIAQVLATDEAQEVWRGIAAEHQLRCTELADLLGQSHHYLEMLLNEKTIAKRALPTLVSSLKVRQAGFASCRDTFESLIRSLAQMENLRLLPPMTARRSAGCPSREAAAYQCAADVRDSSHIDGIAP
ncbi:NAD-dependent epimerase/dehydratase family protein [Novosphingobium sp. M1R2S20]|uniref:NAD-dependent epimerase/dehydratase family protein n=1 Tax=Novosphingobium rhizovicinum TaxID=3228928 RepID=A0ABV3R813_9SPHN